MDSLTAAGMLFSFLSPLDLRPRMVDFTSMESTYVTARFALWMALGLVSVLDDIVHWNVRSSGWQLHRCISALMLVFIVQELFTIAYTFTGVRRLFSNDPSSSHTPQDSESLYACMIFVYDLADSAFLGLLLLVWCWAVRRL